MFQEGNTVRNQRFNILLEVTQLKWPPVESTTSPWLFWASYYKHTYQAINQSINQPTNQSINQDT